MEHAAVLSPLSVFYSQAPLDLEPKGYIPAPWAHRCINTGQEPLVYLGVFPADTQRDYSFDTSKFRKLVIERDGKVMVVDSPAAG